MQESKYNLATGFNGGVSLSVRADSADELVGLVAQLQTSQLGHLLAQSGVTVQASPATALHAVQSVIPDAQVVPFPQAPAVQPLPVPPAIQQQYAQPVPNQGQAPVCAHGPMQFKPAGFSQRTNKSYPAFWSCQGPREQQCKSQNA